MAKKWNKNRIENSLTIEDDRYYDSGTYGIDPGQEDDFNYSVED